VRKAAGDANFRASHAQCRLLWSRCAASLAALRAVLLPSRRRFHARVGRCNDTLSGCVGPAAAEYHERLALEAGKGEEEFNARFHGQLSHALFLLCVGGILTFRYVAVSALAEVGCWLLLASVELLPRLAALAQFSPVAAVTASVWETAAGQAAVEWYEAVVFNPVADLDNLLLPLAATLLAVHTARHRPRDHLRSPEITRDCPRLGLHCALLPPLRAHHAPLERAIGGQLPARRRRRRGGGGPSLGAEDARRPLRAA